MIELKSDLIFHYKSFGKDCGFLACNEKEFIFKPDRDSCCTISLEKLKNNLRVMVKNKTAKLVRTAAIEAVVVPKGLFHKLYI